jgi:trigger factor
MTEETCRRELELEIPAEEVQKAAERIAKEFARVARIPGFRPGKAPVGLVRRRFAEEIRGEVMQSLVPETIEKAVAEKKMVPVTQPQVDKVDYAEGGPLKFRAVFEVLPEFELKDYKDLEVEIDSIEVTDEDVEKTLAEMRERAATFVPVEGRAIQDGDFAVLKLTGTPVGGGAEPIQAENVTCHIGAEETISEFNENLGGANVGEHKRFEVKYPDDYPDPKLAGKAYTYGVDVVAIKEKKLPELDDNFAKDVSDTATVDELRGKIRQNLEAVRDHRQTEQTEEKLLEKLVALHEFPVPQALVEHQMDVRLERVVRQLAAQGVDPRAVNVDWVTLRRRQQERAVSDVKAEMILDRVADAEKIEISDADVDAELEKLAQRGGESAEALRARLTKQGSLDRMKSKLRGDRTLAWLRQNSRIQATAKEK